MSVLRHDLDAPPDRAVGQQRRKVLDLLKTTDAVDAQHVADTLQIHITTARFHLTTLEEQGAMVEEADPGLPDTRAIFGRVWGVALARLVATTPPEKRALLDQGLAEVAEREGGMSAVDFLGAEALRIEAAHAMARFHQRFDILLTAATPTAAFAADQPTIRPTEALWRDWAPWTFAFNLTRQPAISVPIGLDEAGMPRAVQVAAALHRDDLAFRAARALERAAEVPAGAPLAEPA